MRLQLEFLWKIAVEGEMLHIYKPRCACFCPAWLTARKTDLVNPGGIREEGFSGVFAWINVTGCS